MEAAVFTVAVPGSVTYWLPRYAFGLWGPLAPASPAAQQSSAAVLLMVGLAVFARCVWDFVARGRGIPVPVDHPRQLVVTGLYRYVRNPMYLGVLLVLLGEALYFGSVRFLIYTMLWLLLVHVFVIVHEEPYLTARFGDSYRHYRGSVRRWIPGARYRADA
jgi:protein-S-isoprenylcysteine O-methyltransferase Ste14